MYYFIIIQKLLILPELHIIAITSNPIKTTSRICSTNVMHTHKLTNKQMNYNTLSSNDISIARIIVSGLTASWTNVSIKFTLQLIVM